MLEVDTLRIRENRITKSGLKVKIGVDTPSKPFPRMNHKKWIESTWEHMGTCSRVNISESQKVDWKKLRLHVQDISIPGQRITKSGLKGLRVWLLSWFGLGFWITKSGLKATPRTSTKNNTNNRITKSGLKVWCWGGACSSSWGCFWITKSGLKVTISFFMPEQREENLVNHKKWIESSIESITSSLQDIWITKSGLKVCCEIVLSYFYLLSWITKSGLKGVLVLLLPLFSIFLITGISKANLEIMEGVSKS